MVGVPQTVGQRKVGLAFCWGLGAPLGLGPLLMAKPWCQVKTGQLLVGLYPMATKHKPGNKKWAPAMPPGPIDMM